MVKGTALPKCPTSTQLRFAAYSSFHVRLPSTRSHTLALWPPPRQTPFHSHPHLTPPRPLGPCFCHPPPRLQHKVEVKQDGVTELVLDTRGLAISGAKVDGAEAEFSFGEAHKVMH